MYPPLFDQFDVLVVAGLALDIFGAIVIVIPDFPMRRNQTKIGRLVKGHREMENGTLTLDDPGFEDIQSIFKKLEPVDDFNLFKEGLSGVKIEYESSTGSLFGASPVNEFYWVYSDKLRGEYFDEVSENDDRRIKTRYEAGNVRNSIREEIERLEQKIRSGGFILLASGFFLQLVAELL